MKKVHGHRYGRIIVLCLVAACYAALLPPAYAKAPGGSSLLQFTSGSHLLGFREGSLSVASATHMLKVDFVGAESSIPVAHGGASVDGRAIPLTRVTYPRAWDGVDIVYEKANGSIVKSTYTVSPGKAPAAIRLRYNRPLAIDTNGNLVIAYDTGRLTESRPVAWQVVGGSTKPVMVAYNLYSVTELGFTVGDYDKELPLVIDPSLTWNTFLGGSGNDTGWAMAVDASGNAYVTGFSNAAWGSPVRPYTSGWDCYVAKLASDGTLLWNTFLGGTGQYEYGQSIAVDTSGNVYVAGGGDGSWGSPVRPYTVGWDCFVAKLASDGTLLWNTFLGGSVDEGGRAVAVDASRNVYVTGYSEAEWGSPVRPYTEGDDAFVAKLASDGTLLWNTFLGGSATDSGWAIAADSAGNVYVAGESGDAWGSPVRPYTEGDDAFVVKLATDGTLLWNTFLGGTGSDYAFGVGLDTNGGLYVAGQSYDTWGSPIRAYEGLDDAFAARLSTDGTLLWNTFLGGSGSDGGHAIAVDPGEGVYVAGGSDDTWGSPFRPYTGSDDAFVAKVGFDGTLLWNTFLGGDGYDVGYAIGVDLSGGVYVAGVSWETWGSPIRPYTANSDAFVAKIVDTNPCTYTVNPESKSLAYRQGSATVTVEATGAANCPEPTLSASDPWISPGLASFTKNKGKVKIAVAKNPAATERTGTVTVENALLTVNQKGAPCSLTIAPSRASFAAEGGSAILTVTATEGCGWTAEVEAKAASWLSATPLNGTGSGSVTCTAAKNEDGVRRTGRITVALTGTPVKKKVLTVTQTK